MKRLSKKLGAIVMSAVMTLSFTPVSALAEGSITEEKVPVYGLYNPNSGEHYFTLNVSEVANLQAAGWQEGNIKWYAPTSGTEVYCLYNPNVFASDGIPLGDHHYTANENERDDLLKAGWKQGDLAFYSANLDENADPIYGVYNPYAYATGMSGAHHLTVKRTEVDNLLSLGWKEGDPKFYGYAVPEEEVKYDVLADGKYSPDIPRWTGHISGDLRMLTINTAWYQYNTGVRTEIYPKKEYQIPISENCMVNVWDGSKEISKPISEMMYYLNLAMGSGTMMEPIEIKNGDIVNIWLSP